MLSKDKIDDKDLIIARLKGVVAEMATFISHFDLEETICKYMAEENGEKEFGVCQCSCEECVYNYFAGKSN